MTNKRVIPVVAILLVAVGILIAGLSQVSGIKVPPGSIVESPNAKANPGGQQIPVTEAPALSPATSGVLFYDDFAKDLDKWENLSSAPGTWVAEDGRLQQRGDANGDVADSETVLVARNLSLDNGRFEAQVYPTSGSGVGLVFRGSDQGYYRLKLYQDLPNDTAKAVLEAVTGEHSVKTIASAPVTEWPGLKRDQWRRVAVAVSGNRILVTVDDVKVIDTTDNTFGAGWIGIWTLADRGAQFDNVRVQSNPNL